MAQLKLEFNPYTYIRVQVMRTLLLRRDDYDRLLKMEFAEIAQYLSKTSYRKQIEELGARFSGADLLERALNQNMVKSFEKIKRISDNDLRLALETYLLREDVHNLKVLIRGMITKTDKARTLDVLMPVGFLKAETLQRLADTSSPQELLMQSQVIDPIRVRQLFRDKEPSMLEIENMLDQEYFRKVIEFASRMSKSGDLFVGFLKNEIDISNLISILRFRTLGLGPEEMKRLILYPGRHLNQRRLNRLMAAANDESFLRALRRTPYHKILDGFIGEKKESLVYLKAALQKELLSASLKSMHKNLLSVELILAFVLTKETEVRNLKVLVKGKQLGIEPDIIGRELVC